MTISKTELNFKLKITRLRNEQKLTKAAVAKGTGLDYSYYHRLENLKYTTTPKFSTFEAIADFYGIPVAELFSPPSSELVSPEKFDEQ